MTTSWTTAEVYQLASLADAAYLPEADARTAITALGCTYVGQLGSDECVVHLLTWGIYKAIAIQGTRVTSDLSIPELWDDVDAVPANVGGDLVHGGFWSPLAALWPTVAAHLPADGPRLVLGHSLGGVRAHLAAALCPGAAIVSLGAPRGASAAFWHRTYDNRPPPLRVVNEADFAPAWPPDQYEQPCDMNWLHHGGRMVIDSRSTYVLPVSVSDHDIAGAYMPHIKAMAPDLVWS